MLTVKKYNWEKMKLRFEQPHIYSDSLSVDLSWKLFEMNETGLKFIENIEKQRHAIRLQMDPSESIQILITLYYFTNKFIQHSDDTYDIFIEI